MIFSLFGKKKTKPAFHNISPEDKGWVEESFEWLIQAFGYPYTHSQQIEFTKKHFPESFKGNQITISLLIKDLCRLLLLNESIISVEIIKDIRDLNQVPHAIEGRLFDSDIEIDEGNYKIVLANALQQHPKLLLRCLLYELIRIKLIEHHLLDDPEEVDHFVYLAAIYFGLGVLMAQGLVEVGRSTDGMMQTKWNYSANMPNEVMAYGFAVFAKLIDQDKPGWVDALPKELQTEFESAIHFLHDNPCRLVNATELKANKLYQLAYDQYLSNDFKKAIASLKEALAITKDVALQLDVLNNLGYYHLRSKYYAESVPFLREAIQLDPTYGYAIDNLGYAFIKLGNLAEGKALIEQALQTESNDHAYSYRNLALYQQAMGNASQAELFFQKAFNAATVGVDLLEYYYSIFLMEQGKKDEALNYLNKACEKGEPEALELKKRMNY